MWNNRLWSHRVHEKLGETLHYYFLRIKPFDAKTVERRLFELISHRRLGGIRVYPVYGRFDLVISAWLHPVVAVRFPKLLDVAISEIRDIKQFTVSEIVHTWFDHGEESASESMELLARLNEQLIQEIHEGRGRSAEFERSGMIRSEESDDGGIEFAVAVKLPDLDGHRRMQMARELAEFCRRPVFSKVSVYIGVGDSYSIILRAATADYFSIGEIPLRFSGVADAETETFLLLGRKPLLSDGRIGLATFGQLHGKDLVVQSIIPEVYEEESPDKLDMSRPVRIANIEDFIRKNLHNSDLGRKKRQLVRDYLLSYYASEETNMMKVIFEVFVDVERYLRDNLRAYVGRRSQGNRRLFDEIFAQNNLDSSEDRKKLSLGTMIGMYGKAIGKEGQKESGLAIFRTYNELFELRNATFHGDLQLEGEKWSEPIRTLVARYDELAALLEEIGSVTGKFVTSRYF